MDELDYICPIPKKWHEIHQILYKNWGKISTEGNEKPPVPLILSGWAFTDDSEKKQRWIETLRWANKLGFYQLIPKLTLEEKYTG